MYIHPPGGRNFMTIFMSQLLIVDTQALHMKGNEIHYGCCCNNVRKEIKIQEESFVNVVALRKAG